MAFSDNITVPVRDFHDQIPAAVRNALARKAALRSKSGRERELFILAIIHFVQCFDTFADNAMTG
jgi:hypothetical protein